MANKAHDIWTKARAVVHYTQFCRSLRRVAKAYGVSKSSLCRWVHGKQCQPKKRARRQDVTARVNAALKAFVETRPTATLADMVQHVASATRLKRSVPSMQQYRRDAGISRKCLTRLTNPKLADPSVVRAVNAAVQRDDVVSIDETAFYVRDCPRYGYALRGKRARLMLEKPVRGVFRRCTVLAALTKHGILDYTVVEGSCNQHSYASFIQRLDMPSGSIVLMDNVGFHKTKTVDTTLKERHFEALFTPPYSPWCNPIELAFSKIKTSAATSQEEEKALCVNVVVTRPFQSTFSGQEEPVKSEKDILNWRADLWAVPRSAIIAVFQTKVAACLQKLDHSTSCHVIKAPSNAVDAIKYSIRNCDDVTAYVVRCGDGKRIFAPCP